MYALTIYKVEKHPSLIGKNLPPPKNERLWPLKCRDSESQRRHGQHGRNIRTTQKKKSEGMQSLCFDHLKRELKRKNSCFHFQYCVFAKCVNLNRKDR